MDAQFHVRRRSHCPTADVPTQRVPRSLGELVKLQMQFLVTGVKRLQEMAGQLVAAVNVSLGVDGREFCRLGWHKTSWRVGITAESPFHALCLPFRAADKMTHHVLNLPFRASARQFPLLWSQFA